MRYTILNIRLGRNVKCKCDDCVRLKTLVKLFIDEGKEKEEMAVKRALEQHQKREGFKQNRYRTRRVNVSSSWITESLYFVCQERL